MNPFEHRSMGAGLQQNLRENRALPDNRVNVPSAKFFFDDGKPHCQERDSDRKRKDRGNIWRWKNK